MPSHITPAEFSLLSYLREHSAGPGERTSQDPKAIARGLRISIIQFAADAHALWAHGMVGTRGSAPDSGDLPSAKCSAIWLTRTGEEYLGVSDRALLAARTSARELSL